MPKAFTHTGVLMMLAVVALGLVGAGYALWYEELTLNATVNTGRFNADWSVHPVGGAAGGPTSVPVVCIGEPAATAAALGTNCDEYSEYLTAVQAHAANENFGSQDRVNAKMPTCDIALSNNPAGAQAGVQDEANDLPDNNLLTLTVNNAYPYAGCKFAIDIKNSGTVPMHFAFESLSPAAMSPYIGFVSQVGTGSSATVPSLQVSGLCSAIGKALAGASYQDIPGTPPGATVQLHAGEEVDCDLLLYLKEYNPEGTGIAPEGASLAFSWEIIAHQWNEGVTTVNHNFTEPE